PDRTGLIQAAPLVYQLFDLLPQEPPSPPPPAWSRPPALLQRLSADRGGGPIRLADPDRLHLTFPLPGTVLERPPGEADDPV
ncbi:hypothetical protein ACSLVQ_29810, partial [Klebsiella pneumoniae]|uniref:hypothetical protein n=1 Tax=Klebsiella pneumoniae TaxID=573 RepID=UPI003EE09F9E